MKNLILVFSILIFISCKQNEKVDTFSQEKLVDFKPDSYELKYDNIKQIKGQVLYMPIYSNIPRNIDSYEFDMSAFVTFHNTH
jgi:competence protein ComGF